MQHADLSYSLPLPLRSAAGVHISTLSRRVSEFLALFLSLFRCFFFKPIQKWSVSDSKLCCAHHLASIITEEIAELFM